MRALRIVLELQLVQLRSAMAYRGDFWIGIVGAACTQASALVFLVSYFGHVTVLGGWTAWEVLVLGGLATTSVALTELLADGMWALRAAVSDGSFDRVLVRPMSPALQQVAALASIHGLGNLAVGTGMLVLGLTHSAAPMRWWSVPVVVLAVLCGALLSASLAALANMVVFWEPAVQTGFPAFVMNVREFARYPMDVYHAGVRAVLVFVLPYAVVTYLPASVVLDKPGAQDWWVLSPVLAAAGGLGVAALVWRAGLRRYRGAGH